MSVLSLYFFVLCTLGEVVIGASPFLTQNSGGGEARGVCEGVEKVDTSSDG